jgi:hypothetical protein
VINTLAPPGIAVQLLADYKRDGSVPQNADYSVRLLRPGAILLPNLDISDPGRLPAPPPTDLAASLDSEDALIGGNDDVSDMTVIETRFPARAISRASQVVMRIDAKDATRIHIFDTSNPDPTVPGLNCPVVLGDGKAEAVIADLTTAPAPTFLGEAITLAGHPAKPGPSGASPAKPTFVPATLPPRSAGAPVHAKRAPGEVWVELVHQDAAGKDRKSPRELALFTIAPFLLLSSAEAPSRVFVVNIGDLPGLPGNQNFVFDLMEACQSVFGAGAVPLPPSTSTPFTPSTPASTAPVYLIDGAKHGGDPWIQDEMEIGYCFAPHKAMHVVLHCKRNRGLDGFVHAELVAPGVGLFDGLHGIAPDSTEYGGNLEATPPILQGTPALGAGPAGPAVRAHKPAHLGKILLGDCAERHADPEFREFLLAQRVQPVLPIDTSWLLVGHVDEILTFVPTSSPKGFKMLFGSIQAMTVLLEEAKKVPLANGRTGFHRGKFRRPSATAEYAEMSVETLLGSVKTFNDRIRAQKLVPVDQRLKVGLHLDESDIVRVPIYFEIPAVPSSHFTTDSSRTAALTIGMVNMLVLDKDLVIPRPFGTQLTEADATAALKRAFGRLGIKAPVKTAPAGHFHWVEPGDTPERVVCYFTQPDNAADRQNLIDHIKDSTVPLSAANLVLFAQKALEIGSDPQNTASAALFTPIVSGVFSDWVRLFIPSHTVDLIESYMLSVLEPLGFTVHFVDDWFYHDGVGEAHCGTNAVRKMPENTSSRRWWDHYDPDEDTRYHP